MCKTKTWRKYKILEPGGGFGVFTVLSLHLFCIAKQFSIAGGNVEWKLKSRLQNYAELKSQISEKCYIEMETQINSYLRNWGVQKK